MSLKSWTQRSNKKTWVSSINISTLKTRGWRRFDCWASARSDSALTLRENSQSQNTLLRTPDYCVVIDGDRYENGAKIQHLSSTEALVWK